MCCLSTIQTNEDPGMPKANTCLTDNLSIHFNYDAETVDHVTKVEYSCALMLDLLLRNMDVPTNMKCGLHAGANTLPEANFIATDTYVKFHMSMETK